MPDNMLLAKLLPSAKPIASAESAMRGNTTMATTAPPFPAQLKGKNPSTMAADAWQAGGWRDHALMMPDVYRGLPDEHKNALADMVNRGYKLPAETPMATKGDIQQRITNMQPGIPMAQGRNMAGIKG